MFGFSFWKAAIISSQAFFSVSPDQLTKVKVTFSPPPPAATTGGSLPATAAAGQSGAAAQTPDCGQPEAGLQDLATIQCHRVSSFRPTIIVGHSDEYCLTVYADAVNGIYESPADDARNYSATVAVRMRHRPMSCGRAALQ